MFGLDDFLTSFSDGTTLVLVIAVAILLGLRHATDPDGAPATRRSSAWPGVQATR